MTDKYKISKETFRDVFINVPSELRIKCLTEMKDIIDSYISIIEENGDVEFKNSESPYMTWHNDNERSAPVDLVGLDGDLIKKYGCNKHDR
tara:strand:- start:740 stop:1012 length:273 start_codon:yes stop_codon:yes gene_type:complete